MFHVLNRLEPARPSLYHIELVLTKIKSDKSSENKLKSIKMKNLCKAASLAVLGLVSVSGAQAATYPAGDLIIGFTTGSGTDLMFDLGPESGLADGETWPALTTLLSGAGYDLTAVQWGVIGNLANSGTPRTAFTSVAVGTTPATVTGNTQFGQLNSSAKALYGWFGSAGAGSSGTVAAGDSSQNSWYEQMVSTPLTSSYGAVYENPLVTGQAVASLWSVLNDGVTTTLVGQFTLGTNGVVTYNVASSTASTTNVLTSSLNPANFGFNLIFTSTVSVVAPGTGTPTGSVTFKDGGTVLGTGVLDGSGVATYSTSALAAGSHSITAEYAGAGSTFYGSTNSPTLTQVVYGQPLISGAPKIVGGNFQLTFSGTSGQPYEVLSSTNVTIPVARWITNSSGTFGGVPVIYTNTAPTGNNFYRIKTP